MADAFCLADGDSLGNLLSYFSMRVLLHEVDEHAFEPEKAAVKAVGEHSSLV